MKHHGGEIIVRAAALLVVILAVLPRHDTAQGLNRKLPSLLVAATRVESAQEFISPREMVQAIALGRHCQAPIVRVTRRSPGIVVYIESPFARIALVTAAAVLMRQPLDGTHVRRAMLPGYRVWVQRDNHSFEPLTINSITLRHSGRTIFPVAVQSVRFFMGSVPSHGIIPDLRTRFPEFTFPQVPDGQFEVIVSWPDDHRCVSGV